MNKTLATTAILTGTIIGAGLCGTVISAICEPKWVSSLRSSSPRARLRFALKVD